MKKSNQKLTATDTISVKEWRELCRKHQSEMWEAPLDMASLRAREDEIDRMYARIMPEVGDMGTQILWSDCYAFEVVKIHTRNRVGVRLRNFKIPDWEDGTVEVLDGFWSGEILISRRKNGGWYEVGAPARGGQVLYTFAHVHVYRDPSF